MEQMTKNQKKSGPAVTRALFDEYARDYHTRFNANPVARYQRGQIHRHIRTLVGPGQTVLDGGCGPGSDFPLWRDLGVHLTALDPSAGMLRAAARQATALGLAVDLQQGGLGDFQPQKNFDLILLNFGVINLFSDPNPILSRAGNWLNTGGHLLVVAMPPFHLAFWLEKFLAGKKAVANGRLAGKVILANGTEVFYGGRPEPGPELEWVGRQSLGWLLPTPEQAGRFPLLAGLSRLAMVPDYLGGRWIPEAWGGDHLLYCFRKRA